MSTTKGQSTACLYCGHIPGHPPEQCLMVAAIEYHPNGTVKRIEKASPYTGNKSIFEHVFGKTP